MVQIRRARPLHPHKRGGAAARGVLASVALSALIPLLFALRLFSRDYLFRRRQPADENPYVQYLQSLDLTQQNNLPGNVVELHYCDTSGLDWSEFVQMVEEPILHPTLTELLREQDATTRATTINDQNNHNRNTTTAAAASSSVVAHEWLLQLLEQYLQITGRCDYHRYRPTVPPHAATTTVNAAPLPRSCLAVVVISAFRDPDQLEALLQALLVPSAFLLEGDGETAPPQDDDGYDSRMCVVIHLEESCPTDYRTAVQRIIDDLPPPHHEAVTVLQFGTVVYRTDSLSLINLRILRWLSTELADNFDYQYAILLDGSAYPLYSGRALAEILRWQPSQRAVWLGEITHKGQKIKPDINTNCWDRLLRHKRLIDTTSIFQKRHKRLPRDAWDQVFADSNSKGDYSTTIPDRIRQHMIYKSTSGNQAIFRRDVVEQLLESDTVMELFALSKYACCCCLEEHNWIAALSMIGYAHEALEQPMMFQSWGGESTECQGTMNNAVLSRNASLCFRTEDPNTTELYYTGDQTWATLVEARRRRGYLFARKFQSDRVDSVELRDDIRSQLWKVSSDYYD